MFKKCKQR